MAAAPPRAFSDVQTYLHERIDEVLTNGTTDGIRGPRRHADRPGSARRAGQRLATVVGPGARADRRATRPRSDFSSQVTVQVNLAAAPLLRADAGVIRRAAAIMMASEPM